MPEELYAFIEHVSGNVYQMDCWKNQLGSLESKEQMSPEDYLVENNLIGFECKKLNESDFGPCGNCEVTQYVIATLTALREVRLIIFLVKSGNDLVNLKLESPKISKP